MYVPFVHDVTSKSGVPLYVPSSNLFFYRKKVDVSACITV